MPTVSCPRTEVQLSLFPAESEDSLLEPERWLPVEDWLGYEVSDYGRLRSYHGRGWRPGRKDLKTPIVIGGYIDQKGHVRASFSRTAEDGRRECWQPSIHVLVLNAFVGLCPPGLQCCRKDGNLGNNRLSNLSWDEPHGDDFDCGEPERWLPILDWPHYEVSDLGRVRTYKVRYKREISANPTLMKGVIIDGYLRVLFTKRDPRKSKVFLVNRLVLMAFVGDPPDGMESLHRDGNSLNNRLKNLRYGTSSQNRLDALKHGTAYNQRLSEADIPAIWDRLVACEPVARIARDYGVSVSCISPIRHGINWSHITRNLPGWPLVDPDRNDRKAVYPEKKYLSDTKESWKLLDDLDGYRVSSWGRMQSCRSTGGRNKAGFRGKWHDLPGSINADGYIQFCLTRDDGKRRQVLLHQAVLKAFAGPRPEGFVACHRDGNPLNCHASNLRWDTPASNARDHIEHAKK
jgi:hypothetical protein